MNPPVADEDGDVDANQARLYREWGRDNSGAMGRIKKAFGNIKRRELTAADVTDAFSMWAKVQTFKLDGAQSMTRIYQAQWEKCGWNFKNESAMQFFSKLDTIQIAMDNTAGDERISDIKYIHKVMMSLPKSWSAFVAAYEVSDADIELPKLKMRIMEKELKDDKIYRDNDLEKEDKGDKDESALYGAKTTRCYDCGEKGHFKGASGCKGQVCFNCGLKGHIPRDCRKNKGLRRKRKQKEKKGDGNLIF